MQYRIIPMQANFKSINPRIRYSASEKITIPKTTERWSAKQHIALVNNYGAAGSNAAIALRDYPYAVLGLGSERRYSSSFEPYPIMISAKSTNSAKKYMDALISSLAVSGAPIEDVAYNLARRQNPSFEYRLAFTATDAGQLAAKNNETICRAEKQPVVLCFGGQTGSHVTVSKHMYERCDLFREHLVGPRYLLETSN